MHVRRRLEGDLELRTGQSKPMTVSSSDIHSIAVDASNGLAELLEVRPTSYKGQGSHGSEGQHQLVSILQAQRDRYKDRLTQVEASLLISQQQFEAATAAKTQLEADNLSLYGKIRFLQSYGSVQSQVSRGPVKSMKLKGGAAIGAKFEDEFGFGSVDDQRDVERRYRGLYEQGISPFAEVCSILCMCEVLS